MSTKPSYRLCVGVDIAYRTFTAASLVPGSKPQRAPKAFEQTSQGFEHFESHLLSSGIEPDAALIVMEATGSYWVALATVLVQAGFAVSVINPAQAHYEASAQLRQAKTDTLDAEMPARLAQSRR